MYILPPPVFLGSPLDLMVLPFILFSPTIADIPSVQATIAAIVDIPSMVASPESKRNELDSTSKTQRNKLAPPPSITSTFQPNKLGTLVNASVEQNSFL